MQRTFQTIVLLLTVSGLGAAQVPPPAEPLVRTVDLDIGESQDVLLSNGRTVAVRLVDLAEVRDDVTDGVGWARVTVEVDGKRVEIASSPYGLKMEFEGVQLDSPITGGYLDKANGNMWALDKDARIRLWPKGSPWINPGTFTYPARQRWFASSTQMANEPVYVDGGDTPDQESIYYHYGLDIGGCEGRVDVVAATDGLVVSSGDERLPGFEDSPASPRYDVVYIRDYRGWFYRYSHMKSIEPEVRPGRRVRMGQKIGVLGKEGGSGGWSHLHLRHSKPRNPRGRYGIMEGYAFLWQAYQRRSTTPKVLAVARPHHFLWSGQTANLDGSSSEGRHLSYEWTFSDGTTAEGAKVQRTYATAGSYSEILKVTDAAGNTGHDFAIVQVVDRDHHPDRLPLVTADHPPHVRPHLEHPPRLPGHLQGPDLPHHRRRRDLGLRRRLTAGDDEIRPHTPA